jgi:hypothetical protein
MQTIPTPPGFMTQAAFSRYLGVDKSTVAGYRRRGLLVMSDGLVDVEASEQMLSSTWRPSCKRGAKAPDPWEPITDAIGKLIFLAALSMNGKTTWDEFRRGLRARLDEKLSAIAELSGLINFDRSEYENDS